MSKMTDADSDLWKSEKAILRRECQQDEEASLYNDWFSDNVIDLRREFVEEMDSEFKAFCKQRFKERDR